MIKMNDSKDNSLEGVFEEYLNIKIANGLSLVTVKTARNSFQMFCKFLKVQGEESLDISVIDKQVYLRYIGFLKGRKIRDMTIKHHCKEIKTFFLYAINEGYIQYFEMKAPSAISQMKIPYTDEELLKLLKKPDMKSCSFTEYRNWVMIQFFIATGLRRSSVSNILIMDVDFIREQIYIRHVKTKKPMYMAMSPEMKKLLTEYLKIRKGQQDDYLFCDRYGKPLKPDTMTKTISEFNQKRGVEKTSVHLFRNTFACKWLQGGGDRGQLQKVLGHSTGEMTNQYVEWYCENYQDDFAKLNPLDSLKKQAHKNQIQIRP